MDTYTKQEVDDELNTKADKLDTYTKQEVDDSLDLKANKQQEEWITPTLLNGWAVFSANDIQPGYYKDSLGNVHLRGTVKGGLTGGPNPILTLPVGYQPSKNMFIPCINSGTLGILVISRNGTVYVFSGTVSSYFSFGSEIIFKGEQ